MNHRILQVFASPTFEDEDKTRIAFLLNAILLTFLLGDISYIVFSVLTAVGQTPSGNWLNVFLTGWTLAFLLTGLLILLRRGYVRGVATIFVLSYWSIVTLSYIAIGGVKTSGLNAYIVVVIIAALLIGARAALFFGGISVLTGLALFYAEQIGLIAPFGNTPLENLTTSVITVLYLILASVFLSLAANSISKALARARQNERALADQNQDLEHEIASRRQTEEAYQLLVEQMSQGLFIFQDNRIVFANKAVTEQTSRTLEELLSLENPFELIHPDDWSIVARNIQSHMEGEPALTHFDLRLVVNPHQIRWIEIFAARIIYKEKAAIQALTIDVTERRQAEVQTLELALANERVEFLTEFLGNMSHDLKTPLTIINTSLYLLDKLQDPANQQSQLKKINEQTQLLEKYIQDILTISRLDHTQRLVLDSMTAVNLNDVIHKVESELRPSAEKKNLKTMLNLEINLPTVPGDADELYRALINLVENAFNYTPEGGTVSIDTFTQNHQIVAKVSDTGSGISQAELPYIFDRFYRGEQAKAFVKSGSGLGLAIVKRVIDLHHGTILVESIPAKGTSIELRLSLGQ